MSTSNLELVFDHINARRNRDLARLKTHLDPQVVHQGVRPELICHDREEVLENIQLGFARDDFGVDRLEMIEAGEMVIVGLAGPRFTEVPWAPLNGQIYVLYTIGDGRIVRMEDFIRRADAIAAAGVPVTDWA